MDKRGREASKRHRNAEKGVTYQTVPLMLEKKTIDSLIKAVSLTEEKNMSKFIEEILKDEPIKTMPKRRKFGTYPEKKTFTFSKTFVEKLDASGNRSLFIEYAIKKHFTK